MRARLKGGRGVRSGTRLAWCSPASFSRPNGLVLLALTEQACFLDRLGKGVLLGDEGMGSERGSFCSGKGQEVRGGRDGAVAREDKTKPLPSNNTPWSAWW